MLDVGHRVLTLFRTAIGPIADLGCVAASGRPLSPGRSGCCYETAHRSGLLHPRAP